MQFDVPGSNLTRPFGVNDIGEFADIGTDRPSPAEMLNTKGNDPDSRLIASSE